MESMTGSYHSQLGHCNALNRKESMRDENRKTASRTIKQQPEAIVINRFWSPQVSFDAIDQHLKRCKLVRNYREVRLTNFLIATKPATAKLIKPAVPGSSGTLLPPCVGSGELLIAATWPADKTPL